MLIRAMTVLGVRDLNTGVSPIFPGTVAEIDDETAKRFIENCVAIPVPNPGAVETAKAPLTQNPGKNPSDGGNAQEGAKNGELEGMSFNELKAIAKDLGVETGKIRSKEGMINAILVARMELEENFPTISPQDVVEE